MKKSGFTLIELLVVIAIISILTIITVGQFQTARKRANDVARKGDLNSLSKSLQMYFADFGVFPDVDAITWGGTFEDSTVSPPYVYMQKLPRESILSIPYCYKISADGKKYGLFAQLESTTDIQCANSYVCNGNTYCYGIASPNTSLTPTGDLL
jgi:prepilin-type N-terminal cleavage/methylation domain-containing protein